MHRVDSVTNTKKRHFIAPVKPRPIGRNSNGWSPDGQNGRVKILKPADPELLKKYKESLKG